MLMNNRLGRYAPAYFTNIFGYSDELAIPGASLQELLRSLRGPLQTGYSRLLQRQRHSLLAHFLVPQA